jgi:inorganic pyrophosphatase
MQEFVDLEIPMNHPWHHVNTGVEAPTVVNSIVEIPKGSRAKYELDKETGLLKLDRVLFSAMYYPANYGFIPQTYCDDDDPLDILVLSQVTIVPMCLVRAKPIGVMRMLDNNEADDKIIAVAADDISVSHINDISDLPEHLILEVRNFFEDYKKLEHKTVKVEEFQNREVAFAIIQQAIADYHTKFSR